MRNANIRPGIKFKILKLDKAKTAKKDAGAEYSSKIGLFCLLYKKLIRIKNKMAIRKTHK